MMTLGRDLKQISDIVLEASGADATEVVLTETDSGLTRFANNEIHQNVAERSVSARVRVVIGRRTGVAGTNQVDPASLRQAARTAAQIARYQPERGDLPALPASATGFTQPAIDRPTAEAGPEERAALAAEICEPAQKRGVRAFGAVSTGTTRYAVGNSAGLWLECSRLLADLKVVAMDEGGSGYADRSSSRLSDIDAAGAGQEAIEKAQRSRDAEAIEAGTYPVVLEEYAVGELLEYLSWMGFGALAVEEGRSFMRLGEQLTGANIAIWDDAQDPAVCRCRSISRGWCGVAWTSSPRERRPASCTTWQPRPARGSSRPGTGCLPPIPSGRGRPTSSWRGARPAARRNCVMGSGAGYG